MRTPLAVPALLAASIAATAQAVEIKDLGVTLKARPDEAALVIPFDEEGYGVIEVSEPGEYELRLESKSATASRYTVEAEVGVDTPVVMDDSAGALIGAIHMTTAPKLHIIEFAGPDSVVIDKLAVSTPGTVIRVRLIVKGPEPEGGAAETEHN